MIIRSLRPCALRIKGVRYVSASRDPLRKNASVPRRNHNPSARPQDASSQPPDTPSSVPTPPSVSETLAAADPAHNNLLAPVHIPEDPNAIIKSQHPATKLLANSGLVVQRQIEMMNLFLGFEQANRYVIMDAQGNHVGYMAEHDGGFGKAMGRQWFRTHRAFTTHVFDREQKEVLRVWFLNHATFSRVRLLTASSSIDHSPGSILVSASMTLSNPPQTTQLLTLPRPPSLHQPSTPQAKLLAKSPTCPLMQCA